MMVLPSTFRFLPFVFCLICYCLYPYAAIAQLSEDMSSDVDDVAETLLPVIGIFVEEEYNDNIYLRSEGELDDYITRIITSFLWTRSNPLWNFDISYSPRQIIYTRNTERNELRHTANLAAGVTLVRNLAFLDVTDTFARVSLDSRRERTGISSFAGQTDSNLLSIHPYFRRNISRSTRLEVGYEYTNTNYNSVGASSSVYGSSYGTDRESHGVTAIFEKNLSERLDGDVSYRFTRDIVDDNGSTLYGYLQSYDRHEVNLAIRYNYSRRLDLSVSGGVNRIKFDSDNVNDGTIWDSEISYRFSAAVNCAYRYYQSYENSVQYGVYKLKRQSVELSYERRTRLALGFFTTGNEYLEINRKDKSWGVTTSVDVPIQRSLEFRMTGDWRNRTYDPEGETLRRSIARASMRWAVSRSLSFEAGYRYAKEKSSINYNSYNSNAVYLRANAEF